MGFDPGRPPVAALLAHQAAPADRARCADAKMRRRLAARHAARDRRQNARPEIHRQRLCHALPASRSGGHRESDRRRFGNRGRFGQHCLADAGYDSNGLRRFLAERGSVPVIPNNPTRTRVHPFDKTAYRARNVIERAFCRLKGWRGIATRYDKLATNFASAVAIAAIGLWWS